MGESCLSVYSQSNFSKVQRIHFLLSTSGYHLSAAGCLCDFDWGWNLKSWKYFPNKHRTSQDRKCIPSMNLVNACPEWCSGRPISAQKMQVGRMGFPAVTTPTAIKRDIIQLGKLLKFSNILLQNLKRRMIILLVPPKLLGLFGNHK